MIGNDWDEILADEFESKYLKDILNKVGELRKIKTIYPCEENVFRALKETPFNDVKVVILGQDPYHGPNQANGLAFSVNKEVDNPPSLKNIYQEMESDLGKKVDKSGDLSSLAKSGVLLLNTVLTVEAGIAASHKELGWQRFTDAIITKISERSESTVFILWGAYARGKKALIKDHHLIIESVHPSPLSAYNGFFGSKPFSKANNFIKQQKKS